MEYAVLYPFLLDGNDKVKVNNSTSPNRRRTNRSLRIIRSVTGIDITDSRRKKRQLDEEYLVGNIPDKVAVEGDLGFSGITQ